MEENTSYDEQFWADYQTQHDTFQEACLLNIVTEMYDRLACRTSSLGGEAYVKEVITSAHPHRLSRSFLNGSSNLSYAIFMAKRTIQP